MHKTKETEGLFLRCLPVEKVTIIRVLISIQEYFFVIVDFNVSRVNLASTFN